MTSERYDEGFMAGLAGAHAELRVWELGDHEPTCDCDPWRDCAGHRGARPAGPPNARPLARPSHRGVLQTVRGVLSVLVSRRGIVE